MKAGARIGAAVGSALALVAACNVGQSPVTGIGEPIEVPKGQFIEGPLPGRVVPDGGARVAADGGASALSIVGIMFASTQVLPGVGSKSFSGSVSDDAAAVGVRLADMGTGYWVVPVGPPDAMIAGALTFSIAASFDAGDAPGLHDLQFVAIDASGNAGNQFDLQICIDSRIPDNGHACDPTIPPPAAVFSLRWDTNFDLDLHVVTSGGVDYNPKTPYGEPLEAGIRSPPSDAPYIDRDSLRACVPDGLRQEDLVFPDVLPKGVYEIYVDPYAACGQTAAHFTFTVYQKAGKCPGCDLRGGTSTSGELLASQVTGGVGPPLFVKELFVQ